MAGYSAGLGCLFCANSMTSDPIEYNPKNDFLRSTNNLPLFLTENSGVWKWGTVICRNYEIR